MNPVSKALEELRYEIPIQILEAAFMDRRFSRFPPVANLDSMIREKVIEERVLNDCNLTGGTQVIIPLAGLPMEYYEASTVIIRIPKDRTQNRRISRTTSVIIGLQTLPGTQAYGMNNQSDYMSAAAQVFASQASIPIQSTAQVSLIAENTIMIADQTLIPASLSLLCYLEHDIDFTSMRSMTISKFTKLVEFAVKAYIYNKLTIQMAEGYMAGGLDIGRFKEIVDGYADANENYKTYLNDVWIKVQVLDDHHSRNRFYRTVMGGSW